MSIELVLITLGFMALLVFELVMHKQTMNNLLDRLMAKSLPEYKAVEDKTPVEVKSLSDRQEYEIEAKRKGITPVKEEE